MILSWRYFMSVDDARRAGFEGHNVTENDFSGSERDAFLEGKATRDYNEKKYAESFSPSSWGSSSDESHDYGSNSAGGLVFLFGLLFEFAIILNLLL
jgi:hypothetical protein